MRRTVAGRGLAESLVGWRPGSELAFVRVRHEFVVDGATVGIEEQDIVCPSSPDAAGPCAIARPEAGIPEPAGPGKVVLA